MIEREILVDSIRTDRRRRDVGDVEPLAKSIASIGLIYPVVIGPDVELILGPRRLAAIKLLGSPMIPAIQVDTLEQAIERMLIERDDDTESKPMLRSEMVSMGRVLEWLDGPARSTRRVNAARAGGLAGGRTRTFYGSSTERITTAMGVSIPTYSRAKHVVTTAAMHPDPEIRAFAREQLAIMDGTGNVHGPYIRVRAVTRPAERPNASIHPLKGAAAQRRAFGAVQLALTSVADGLNRLTEIDERITADEAAHWVDGLAESRRVIERTINRLRQHSSTEGKAT